VSRARRFDVDDPLDLPAIDLGAAEPRCVSMVPLDRRAYEDRFAELAFGLGVVPRKLRRDDAWWETPAGMLTAIGVLLVLVWIAASAR
jgi:hypothetical protein